VDIEGSVVTERVMCILASAGGFGYIGLICGYTEFICGYFADIQDSVVTERVMHYGRCGWFCPRRFEQG